MVFWDGPSFTQNPVFKVHWCHITGQGSLFFLLTNSIPLYKYTTFSCPFVSSWTLSYFHVFGCYEHPCVRFFLCVDMCFRFSRSGIAMLTFLSCGTIFWSSHTISVPPPMDPTGSQFFAPPHQHLHCCLFNFSHPSRCGIVPHCSFDLHFSMPVYFKTFCKKR